jgi:small basic protein
VGIATGVASLGAIFQSQIDSKLSGLLPNAPSGLAELVASGGSKAATEVVPAAQKAEVGHAATVAFVSGFNEIILIAAVLSFIGAACGLILVRSRNFVQATSAEAETAAEPAEPVPA